MEFQLDNEWQLQPIKGATGQAYMGTRATEKVFIKRNTSPLLAALSKEGIAPKLVWTKRTVNGDVLTAQEWLDGRLLKTDEIGQRNDVIDVLYHLHHSYMLKEMLRKIGGQIVTPQVMLDNYRKLLPKGLKNNSYLLKIIHYLEENLPDYSTDDYRVVHGDVNYRNWLLSNNYLYLVDWDSVMLADPAVDLGMILGHHVSQANWNQWLLAYGLRPTDKVMKRVYWYVLFSFLQEIFHHYKIGERKETNMEILQLKKIFGH
ncbi:phosphotransferase family protein [Melissococcus plutonius]|uniref:Putative phosphotransferase YtmP n=1 Tax=Melissococcus plutonius TaxID=33970 RepID=A0A2Z5Y108_9ENTE|nr:phosphotransferase family protein [Melissococcus plutonius]BAL61617.1 aminoglycoside phosphotransferase family protein [Melissococcus plutonius DAT561]MCV2498437.1 phosphotransferase family protein [Melissococcus plutonius]MCV2500556.1 phosphotransferase family protein [Melissococcus plutonius]MCV2504452.1 phosphotransferase family protein [Melissococcus plutonius]MCV2507052.1 phosphotransferase family protein [Melissococcus plutonius]